MFIRIICAAFGLLFGGGFGFAIGGIVSALVVGVVFGVFTQSNPVDLINASFNSHPWGFPAALIVFGEVAGAMTGAWFAVKLSNKVFLSLPPVIHARSNVAFLLFLVMLSSMCAIELPTLIRLSLHSVTTTGTVAQLYPHEHGTITYSYIAGGRSFHQRGSPEKLEGLSAGMNVQVYYLPDDPSVSILREPHDEFWRVLAGVSVGSAFICTWLTAAFTIMQQRLKWPNSVG